MLLIGDRRCSYDRLRFQWPDGLWIGELLSDLFLDVLLDLLGGITFFENKIDVRLGNFR